MGWYEAKIEDTHHTQWKFAYEKPVIVSEFGADAQYNRRAGASRHFTCCKSFIKKRHRGLSVSRKTERWGDGRPRPVTLNAGVDARGYTVWY